MPNRSSELNIASMSVLQKFRVIYGSMRRYFREIEDRCVARPAEGLLPAALGALPEVILKTLDINLSELIRYLPRRSDSFAHVPLADMVRANETIGVCTQKDSAALDLECEGR